MEWVPREISTQFQERSLSSQALSKIVEWDFKGQRDWRDSTGFKALALSVSDPSSILGIWSPEHSEEEWACHLGGWWPSQKV